MIDTKKLRAQLEDPKTDKKKVIDDLIVSIDELVLGFNELKKAAEESITIAVKSEALNVQLNQTVMDFAEAMKNIHVILGNNSMEELNLLKDQIAKWILSPTAIKLGVITNANR